MAASSGRSIGMLMAPACLFVRALGEHIVSHTPFVACIVAAPQQPPHPQDTQTCRRIQSAYLAAQLLSRLIHAVTQSMLMGAGGAQLSSSKQTKWYARHVRPWLDSLRLQHMRCALQHAGKWIAAPEKFRAGQVEDAPPHPPRQALASPIRVLHTGSVLCAGAAQAPRW